MKATATSESAANPINGWPVLFTYLAALAAFIFVIVLMKMPLLLILVPLFLITPFGFFIINPNKARVLVLFGRYKGSVHRDGFFWTNPFMMKHSISLRAHNLDGNVLKVNDLLGNPIEISAVVVWRVSDTARATFDVEDYEHFVRVQSEAAVRALATAHPYDAGQADDVSTTLRGSTNEVAAELSEQLGSRLAQAGIEVLEARLNHLAYAPEIASAMLRRQQAKAIVAARQQIVDGAVGMVEMALNRLSAENVLELDDERRANLVGNLLVVLCGEGHPTPVINTGTLYS